MADKIYKVRDPSGNIREIKGPEGASDEEVIAQAQRLFASSTPPEAPSEVPGPRTGVPEWGQRNPVLYGIAGAARESLGPLLQTGAGIAGGLMGTPMGLAGSVGGGALGYAMGEQAMRAADVLLGNVEPKTVTRKAEELAKDVATGAAMEMGGRIAGQVWPSVFNFAKAPIATTRAGLDRLSSTAAAKVARQSAGEKLPEVVNALRSAPAGLTAAQAVSPASSFTTQSLLERAAHRQPEFFAGTGAPGVTEAQKTAAENVLAKLAGGGTQTAARAAAESAKEGLSKTLWPVGKANLITAGIANRIEPRLAAQAEGFLDLATASLDDIAAMQSRIKLGQLPASAAGDAAQMAGKLTTEAQYAQRVLADLESAGLRPLETSTILTKIAELAKDPKLAGLKEMDTALSQIGKELKRWTTADGYINPIALDAIRKNAVNSVVTRLMGNASPTQQQQLAGKLTASLRPIIVDAVEQAGGKGYGAYLKQYSEGLQEVAKQKLSGEAMRLYQKSPQQFVDLVQGNSPDVVEKFLGPGNYNLGTELAQDALTKLRTIADVTQRGMLAAEQATKGQKTYRDILTKNIPRIKLPWGLSPSGAAINKGLDVLERKLGEGVMRKIAEAAKTAQSYDDLLQSLPPDAKFKFTNAIDEMRKTANRQVGATRTQLGNALLDIAGSENRNALND